MKSWKYVPVSPNLQAKVDSEDYERVMRHKWRAISRTTKRLKVVTTISTKNGPRHLTLGKFLMDPKKGMFVFPRRYQNGLDFRKSNLIVCTKKELQRALPKKKGEDSSSKYKGVSYMTKDKRWRARIRVDGEIYSLGVFRTELAAAEAYNKASEKFFGDLGYKNLLTLKRKIREGEN